ncbi:MAG: hypothetical protein L0Z62_15815 [Gemmataceae bacterium]|nr:hypothetical protein [Gemmataceae bacterium]
MSDEQERVWAELEARATRLLEHPKDLEPRESIRLYGCLWRLWHYPPFDAHTAWTILTPGRKAPPGALPLVREVTWDQASDNQRVLGLPLNLEGRASDPQPSIRVRDALIPADDLRHFVEEGAGLAVPLVVFEKAAALDEDVFGLETYEVSPFVRVQWWGVGPAAWRHFTDWVAGLRAFALRHLDE